jgi:hypothetical protein
MDAPFVMPGLVPGIHVCLHAASKKEDGDSRDEPGRDERREADPRP